MKLTKLSKDGKGLKKLDSFINRGEVSDIIIRQASNSLRVFAVGSTYHGGMFNIELRSDEVEGSLLAALGHAINEHEGKAAKNV